MNDDREFDESEMQLLREKLLALPTEIPPPAASWNAIRDRIEHTRVRELTPHAKAGSATPVSVNAPISPMWSRNPRATLLIAASLFVAVATIGGRIIAGRLEQSAQTSIANSSGGAVVTPALSVPPAIVAKATDPLQPDTTVAVSPRQLDPPIAAVLAEFNAAALDLTRNLDTRRSRMYPADLAVVDSALYAINQAIRESRAALVDAPENATIVELLQVTYQQKLDLLRRAADLPMSSHQE